MATSTEEFPDELQDRLSTFDDAVSNLEEILKPLHNVPYHRMQGELSSLDKAKIDLLGAYAVNSLFWVYLNTKGENPKEHGVKSELDRIRSYMARVKEIEDKAKAPKINKDASKRFVRNALWAQAQNADKSAPKQDSTPVPEPPKSQPTPGESEEGPPKKRKKKHNKNK